MIHVQKTHHNRYTGYSYCQTRGHMNDVRGTLSQEVEARNERWRLKARGRGQEREVEARSETYRPRTEVEVRKRGPR